jgi:hypothetical protein
MEYQVTLKAHEIKSYGDIIAWCHENIILNRRHYRYHSRVLFGSFVTYSFESPDDAMLFRLTWG